MRTNLTLSSEQLNWLITSANLGDNIDRTKLVALITTAIEQAQQQPRSGALRRLATSYAQDSQQLLERLRRAHSTAFNTLQKITTEIPEEFTWATRRYPTLAIRGFARDTYISFGKYEPRSITADIASGKTSIDANTLLEFTADGKWYTIPLVLLNDDPIAVAQYIRKRCKAYAAQRAREQARAEAEALAAERKKLEAQLKHATKRLAEIEQMQA